MNEQGAVVDFENLPPRADALIESLRAFGYTVSDAVADIIDNSIAADATNVWLQFTYHSDGTIHVSIRDDGRGMDLDRLRDAMRLGSVPPSRERDPQDLGRYSLGMKTASFSQATGLIVTSKPEGGQANTRYWDLDIVRNTGHWNVGVGCPGPGREDLDWVETQAHGTAVTWFKVDRIVSQGEGRDTTTREKFNAMVMGVRDHLRGAFHLFMEEGLTIHLNGNPIKPWDPFMRHKSHVEFDENIIYRRAGKAPEDIQMTGYVLPVRDELHVDEQNEGAHIKGWNEHQGYYVYRARRLIVAGTWFGLYKSEEHTKLARIAIHLPNNMDHEWHVDVKKSALIPPLELRHKINQYGKKARSIAKQRYTKRAQQERRTSKDKDVLWRRYFEHDRNMVTYRVNRNHPAIAALLADNPASPAVRQVLSLVEKSIPIEAIRSDLMEAKHHVGPTNAKVASQDVYHLARQIVEQYVHEGMKPRDAVRSVTALEGFSDDAYVIAKLEEDFL